MTHRIAIAIVALLLCAPAMAQDMRRLSPAEVERILNQAADKREAATVLPEARPPAPARPIEGEFGVAVGTGGYREIFGTAVVPIGAEGVAIISIDSSQSDRNRTRRRR